MSEEINEKTYLFVELFLKFKRSLSQFQHLLNSSIKRTKTREVFIHVIESLDELLDNLIKILTEYHSLIDPSFKDKPLKDRLEFFKEEFFGYDIIFDNYILIKKVIRAIKDDNYEVKNEFKKDITFVVKIDGREININIKYLKELERKILEFSSIIERIIKEVKSGKIEQSYKI